MRKCLLLALGLSALAACDEWLPVNDGGSSPTDQKCPALPDLTSSVAKCAAAKGLSGDPLLCVDFSQISMVPDAQKLPGWNFSCNGGFSWTSTGGALQVSNFGMFNEDCTVTLPSFNLNDPDKLKYKTLTLALVHRIDLNDPEQKAQIFLNDPGDQTRLMYFATGKKNPSRQITTITLDRAELPPMVNNSPQWRLKLNSSLQVGRMGWQIESIAVLGNTQ